MIGSIFSHAILHAAVNSTATDFKIGQEAPGDWVQTFYPVPEDPNSQESFTFVSESLQRCLKEHSMEPCGNLGEEIILPSRVVEIVPSTTRLFRITNYQENLGPYVALSYCWGNGVPVKFSSSTSTKLCQGTKLEALPETLCKAIKLTERLGYQYIRIDSLCIYQDIPADWEKESSKMGDI
jgi:hypothetical protein